MTDTSAGWKPVLLFVAQRFLAVRPLVAQIAKCLR
jgi:hypothetical protein